MILDHTTVKMIQYACRLEKEESWKDLEDILKRFLIPLFRSDIIGSRELGFYELLIDKINSKDRRHYPMHKRCQVCLMHIVNKERQHLNHPGLIKEKEDYFCNIAKETRLSGEWLKIGEKLNCFDPTHDPEDLTPGCEVGIYEHILSVNPFITGGMSQAFKPPQYKYFYCGKFRGRKHEDHPFLLGPHLILLSSGNKFIAYGSIGSIYDREFGR